MQNRIATTKDIDQIVKIHQDAFGSFFLTSLGADFLRFYYTSFVKNKETVCLVAVDDNEVIGFSAATTKSKGFNTRLICSNIMVFIGYVPKNNPFFIIISCGFTIYINANAAPPNAKDVK